MRLNNELQWRPEQMVEIRGFHGFVFDADKTGPLDNVLTPPYDVIGPEERARLAASGAYNMTHLMLPVGSEKVSPYTQAASLLKAWIAEGILRRDTKPHLYLLRQHFKSLDGEHCVRRAFFALLRLPEPGEQFILGHERTFDRPVEDRLALMRAVQGNLEPIFLMYTDPGLRVTDGLFEVMASTKPELAAKTADGALQELWRTDCSAALAEHLREQTLYIADGHHRFRTARLYRDECRAAGMPPGPQEYVMAGFVAFEDPGLKIFAAHRVVPAAFELPFQEVRQRLAPWFDFRALAPAEITTASLDGPENGCRMLLYARGEGGWLLTLKEERRGELLATDRGSAWCDLDVAVLHRGILDRLLEVPESMALSYEKDAREALALVDRGAGALAFLLRPTRSEQVRDCAESREPMPQKSTYFFPKMPSGAVLNIFA